MDPGESILLGGLGPNSGTAQAILLFGLLVSGDTTPPTVVMYLFGI